jgi:NitT/TauT family transport system permease protein
MLRRALAFLGVLVGLWAVWEGYKAFGEAVGLTWPFPVNDRTMPHIHDMIGQLFEPSRRNGPLLIDVLGHAAAFTAKEAAVGFILGASVGFLLAIVLVHSRLLQRGLLPYIVGSQTVPILAIAPMVVVWLGGRGLPGWFSVSVIAAYLTFFPSPSTVFEVSSPPTREPSTSCTRTPRVAGRSCGSSACPRRCPTSLPL